ncbi:diguanylate cyclase (GGDEF)-like protein/PAS domain S-box-containing protein [Pseudomonas sp. PvR086]|jgi:diguanylate cyclase (GGDEF)-like protein/PAS domain S-box-containing protein|uniref:sensor domain-containing diguanylate cyclase n=1 Tax=Pseudomonas TaxID=286 RepID=UPI000B35A1FB|nr:MULTISPECIES: diguanylate cyclase [Pseudomonas]MBD9608311.1 diguanylate cyclase [Pseudomonas sp. PDM08]MDR7105626.1 diguanylate cyclase (GGDEF)-like protein/PAS domain S-box-containing protein [Pseudomonas frederiksbergensis]PMY55433.1 PAS domain S-box protein [Pseudomonas sp. FW305-53]PMY86460.1 PAS domain S-box protein [Pseudomonas sp. FW303-C2]PMY91848.1 PAS domain S-box protein [Pseudomonas sp. FW305-62]
MSLHAVRPKILGFISEDVSAWLVALLVLLVGGILTGLLAWATLNQFHQQMRQRFQLLASERYSRIVERFEDQEQRLDGLRRFFANSESVSREEFDGYAKPLLRRTQAYSWAPRVSRAERPLLERFVHDEGLSNFTFRELTADGQLQPAAERDEYVPVLYTQTQSRLPTPLGYDLLAQPLRRSTLERADRTGRMVVSQPLHLVGIEPAYSRGVLLVAPVSRQQLPGTTPAGYVMAVISMRQLLADGLPEENHDSLSVRILDLSTDDQHEVLYESTNPAGASDLSSTRLLRLADHDYQVDMRPSAAFLQANHSSVTSQVVLGGLLSLLLSVFLYVLVSQRQRALKMVEQRTEELHAREQELRGTHGQLRGVLDAATQVAIIATDLRGIVSTFNAGAEHMLGYSSAQTVGHMTLENLHLPRELEARSAELSARYGKPIPTCQAMLVEGGEEGGHEAREWTLVRRDGSHLTVNMLATPVLDEQGLWVGYLAICIDITERKRVHEALAARDLLLKKLSAHVPGGIYQFKMEFDGRFSIIYASDGMREIYELELEVLLSNAEAVFSRIHPQDSRRVRASIQVSADNLSPWREEYRVQLPERGLRWVRGEATPEELPGGGVLWHGYISDISDLKRVEEELRALSVTDSLTGIYNRRYFQERLTTEMARVERGGGELSVIMLDIDHFKRINDQHGHAVGDRVLQAVCERIGRRLRRTDVFCRLGGEEFMVLCPDIDGEQAHVLALELWQGLRSSPIDEVGIVTASFGIASWRAGEGADALLLRADSGVYAAKQAGRDRVEGQMS